MNSKPLVSIIIPSFNQSRFIEETLESVISQDYPNIELIVIDGGSTDGSVEIIKRYADKIDYWESEKDRGQSHAINKGYEKSTGQIVNWLCSDDVLFPGVVTKIVDAFEQNPEACGVFGSAVFTNANSEVIAPLPVSYGGFNELLRFWGFKSDLNQPSCYFRRSLIEKAGYYLNEDYHHAMDYDFWCRSLKGQVLIDLGIPIATFRRHEEAKTTSSDTYLDEKLVISRRYWGSPWLPRYWVLRSSVFFALRVRNSRKAWEAACSNRSRGQRIAALGELLWCVILDPSRFGDRHWYGMAASLLLGDRLYRVVNPKPGSSRSSV
jgi:glycosyltransferase involved in cell wall biosynthesis